MSGGAAAPIVLKLGGAVITDKAAVRRIDERGVATVADALARSWPSLRHRLVLAVGSGSFGHRVFFDYGLRGGDRLDDPAFAARVDRYFDDFAALLLARLGERGLPARHLSLVAADGSRPVELADLARACAGVVAAGELPVVTGGIVGDAGSLLAISSDRVAARIAVTLRAASLVLLTNVPGVLRDPLDPSTVIDVVTAAEAEQVVGLTYDSGVLDRTGGMAEKLASLAEAAAGGVPGVIASAGVLADPTAVLRAPDIPGTRMPAVRGAHDGPAPATSATDEVSVT
jgi:isopentenyl phosphate kinase